MSPGAATRQTPGHKLVSVLRMRSQSRVVPQVKADTPLHIRPSEKLRHASGTIPRTALRLRSPSDTTPHTRAPHWAQACDHGIHETPPSANLMFSRPRRPSQITPSATAASPSKSAPAKNGSPRFPPRISSPTSDPLWLKCNRAAGDLVHSFSSSFFSLSLSLTPSALSCPTSCFSRATVVFNRATLPSASLDIAAPPSRSSAPWFSSTVRTIIEVKAGELINLSFAMFATALWPDKIAQAIDPASR
eukprot:scaffold292119_cov54-Attheya_sp.AAC.1